MKAILFYFLTAISICSYSYTDDSLASTMDNLYSQQEQIERQLERQQEQIEDLQHQQTLNELDALNRYQSDINNY